MSPEAREFAARWAAVEALCEADEGGLWFEIRMPQYRGATLAGYPGILGLWCAQARRGVEKVAEGTGATALDALKALHRELAKRKAAS